MERKKSMVERVARSRGFERPMRRPRGTAMALEMKKPMRERLVVVRMSGVISFVVIQVVRTVKMSCGGGRKKGSMSSRWVMRSHARIKKTGRAMKYVVVLILFIAFFEEGENLVAEFEEFWGFEGFEGSWAWEVNVDGAHDVGWGF